MNTAEVMKRGMEYYEKLVGSGFKPYILGAAWLKIKLPAYDILVRDLDLLCLDFDPDRSPIEVERIERNVESYRTKDQVLSIIKRIDSRMTVDENDIERLGDKYMVKNSCWLAATLNKVANYISKTPYDEFRYEEEFSILMSLVNCYVFYFAGMEFDPKRVAKILSVDKFTNSRVAHLYTNPVAYASSVTAWKYYIQDYSPAEILTRFCNKVVKPVFVEMGVYDADSVEPSLHSRRD